MTTAEQYAKQISAARKQAAGARNNKRAALAAEIAKRIESAAKECGITVEQMKALVSEASKQRASKQSESVYSAAQEREATLRAAERAVANLLAAGWQLIHISESGSRYFERNDKRLRFADHLKPLTSTRAHYWLTNGGAEFDHEIIIGSRNWLNAVAELTR